MNSIAYGFRDDITDEELDALMVEGIVFECSEHGAIEEVNANELDLAVSRLRRGADPVERLFGIGQQGPSTRRLISQADLAAQRAEFALDGAEDRPFHFIARARAARGLPWNGRKPAQLPSGEIAGHEFGSVETLRRAGDVEEAERMGRFWVHELPFTRTAIGALDDTQRWARALRRGQEAPMY